MQQNWPKTDAPRHILIITVYQITNFIFIFCSENRAAELTQDRCPASHFNNHGLPNYKFHIYLLFRKSCSRTDPRPMPRVTFCNMLFLSICGDQFLNHLPPPNCRTTSVSLSAVHIQYFTATLSEVRQMRTNHLTLRWLMSYIYGAPILDVSRSHTTTQHSR